MLYLSIEVWSDTGPPANLEDFVKTNPKEKTNLTEPSTPRDKIFTAIQRSTERALGADARLLHIYGTHGSPEVLLMILITGGVSGYKFIKDYPDLRQGIQLLCSDIRTIIKKISGDHLEVRERYPPEAGEDLRKSESV
jgi:hypothetical protein